MMKKILLSRGSLILFIVCMWIISLSAKDTPYLFLDGALKHVNVILKDSTTLVPLRFCSEALNAKVTWDQVTQQITIEKGPSVVKFRINALQYIQDSKTKHLRVAPKLINGVTYMPFRPLVEALNGQVLYNSDYKFINIYNPDSKAYQVYTSLNSQEVLEHRFSMLELPRLSNIPDLNATSHFYIFPLENPKADYFLEYQGSWEEQRAVSLKYYTIVDGVAVNTWGRQVNPDESFSVNTHPLLKLIGDAPIKDKIEFGIWPNPSELNYVMFSQDHTQPAVFYLNDVWTDWFRLDDSLTGDVRKSPFGNTDFVLFDLNDTLLLNQYKQE